MNNRVVLISFELPKLLKDSKLPAGGVSTELLSWIEGFRKNNKEIALFTWKGAKSYINRELYFDIIEVYDPKVGIPKFRFLYNQIPSLLKQIKNLIRILFYRKALIYKHS